MCMCCLVSVDLVWYFNFCICQFEGNFVDIELVYVVVFFFLVDNLVGVVDVCFNQFKDFQFVVVVSWVYEGDGGLVFCKVFYDEILFLVV